MYMQDGRDVSDKEEEVYDDDTKTKWSKLRA
jgi:hypothetical protein